MIRNVEIEIAREMLEESVSPLEPEFVPIEESLGRVLYTSIYSTVDVPDFRRSPLDGYCLRSEDTRKIDSRGKSFEVLDIVGAGSRFEGDSKSDSAIRIMTGAPIPDGYDCVIMQEETETCKGGKLVKLYRSLKTGENIVEIGEDIKRGDLLLESGVKVSAEAMGIIASLGIENVKVYRKPIIGILSTGSELLELGSKKEYGKIYNSNYYTLSAMVREVGARAVNLGVVSDSIEEISKKIIDNMDSLDLLITTGGASVGEYDLINKVYEHIEAQTLFWRVKMKPGTPMLAAKYGEKLLIGLSGNPGASAISFEEIGIPVIKKLCGKRYYSKTRIKAILKDDFKKKSKQRRLARAIFKIEDDENSVYLVDKQSPGSLSSMTRCNCFIDIEARNQGIKRGEVVNIILLKGDRFI